MAEAPIIASKDWLITAGRELMRWWNDRGPVLAPPGEVYAAWWRTTMDSLENDLWGPSDVFEQLQVYAEEARQWWQQNGRSGSPPPVFVRRDIVPSSVSWPLVLVGGIVLWWVLAGRSRS